VNVITRPSLDADRQLAARCAAGDRLAQRELFAQVRRAMHAVMYRILGSNRDLEDLLQDAFIGVFRSIHSYRGESALSTWCCTIATRTTWAHLARRRPATTHLELADEPADHGPSAARVVEARAALRQLYAILDKLDPAQRISFTLAVIDGRALAEVGALTGASVVAVKTRVWRARREIERRAAREPALLDYVTTLTHGDEP
jgi:RNA polymerase sigma-70 factor (ECF subfamily)